MATNNKKYEQYSFKSFLEKYQIIIPIVQRDYAQGRTTDDVNRVRGRFLSAIKDNLLKTGKDNVMKLDFIYGEIEEVWSKTETQKLDRIIVTPLDGQQRLTTLYLLHWFSAKKDNISEEDFKFLNNFTYDIRPSSRDFCAHLMKYEPDWSESFQAQLKDQPWFMGEWGNDPTIIGMLVMLDAIKEEFSSISGLWQMLTGEPARIIFYFLPLSENGLSDELYIKMNSRGKKLTAFEHFKAEYEDLYEKDSEKSRGINHKFDVEWADIFFPYRNNEDIFDNEFMRYFFYISHILCYKQEIVKSNDEFELITKLYKESQKAKENRDYLEQALDCWYDVLTNYKSIDSFFENYLSNSSYQEGKVTTFKNLNEYHNSQNFFHACIKSYQDKFSFSDFLFLYGIITYLINKNNIQENDFRKRLRILRNLIWNSDSGEIRGDADYMRDLLSEVETLMLDGRIDTELKHGFNGYQEKEEIEKQKKTTDLNLDVLYKFEDHPLIYGFVSGLGYENLGLTDAFYKLYSDKSDYLKVHRAMIALGDYTQEDSNRYYMGNSNRSTWARLLHSQNHKNFEENTMCTLRALLQRLDEGMTLDNIIDNFIQESEKQANFDWRYYFAKYPEMIRGADGEFVWDDSNDYICTALNKHQLNGKHWNPFLNVIYQRLASDLQDKYGEKILDLGDYGENITILKPLSSLAVSGTGFVYFYEDKNDIWDISQNEGIDMKDRIEFAINKIESLVQSFMAEQQ